MNEQNQITPAPVAETPSGTADDPVCDAALVSSETPMTPHPKAEEMAKQILSGMPGTMARVPFELESRISLALTPLLEEIERLKKYALESANRELHLNEQLSAFKTERNLLADYHTTACCERDEAREKLTATEEKLRIAEKWMSHSETCLAQEMTKCICGLTAFKESLATIQPTADTKGGEEK